ncbi:hypothetical protein U3516DRAFT_746908 [Neocallimastix sp. 'constans']
MYHIDTKENKGDKKELSIVKIDEQEKVENTKFDDDDEFKDLKKQNQHSELISGSGSGFSFGSDFASLVIKFYSKFLAKHSEASILNYYDVAKVDEVPNQGNILFKEGKYSEAVNN